MFIEIAAQINFLNSDEGGKNVPFGQGLSPKLVFKTSTKEYFTEFNIEDSKMRCSKTLYDVVPSAMPVSVE